MPRGSHLLIALGIAAVIVFGWHAPRRPVSPPAPHVSWFDAWILGRP